MNRNRKSAPKANAPAESPKSVEVPKPAVVEAPKIVVAPKPAPIAVEVPKATTQNVITESAPAVGSDNESSATKTVKAFDPSEFEEISRQLLSDHNSLFNLIKLQKARIDQLSKCIIAKFVISNARSARDRPAPSKVVPMLEHVNAVREIRPSPVNAFPAPNYADS